MEPGAGGSAGPSPSFEEELLCAICYDPFRDAVTLRCGHNFCRGCVSRSWELAEVPACPVCKERASPAGLRPNHTLNNLVEKLLREGAGPARPRGPRLCRLHRGQLGLFCLEDKELLCGSCQGDPRHRGHRLRPVQAAARDYRAKCKNMEHCLREKAKAFRAMHRSYETIVKHNQVEASWLQGRIRQEFEKLREFLRVEERAALDAVTEEAGQKLRQVEEKMKQLAEETEALAHEIGRLQMEMKEDDISFLMKHKSRKRRLSCTTEPEPIQPGMLIDVSKYLDSLQYRVWKKMLSSIEAVPFSFDPNTSAGWLSVSDNLTSVTNHGYRVQVENPERFLSSPCLLGSRAFSHGSHTWEVDLGGLQNWRVGVARTHRESSGNGHSHSCYHDARSGFWYISRTQGVDGDHCVASDPSASPLGLRLPQRLRVELECEEGELSFYDAECQSHLYTFHDRFGEVRPYFYIGGTRADIPPEPLRLCPLHIQVKEEI
ncbi:E3 ubiquitin-protein ligase TRIM35 [Macrotis lagotis]|uniref:E3 ubiquitin-protein ligase TRIM35 n=1 Tax=Macrotis lagotis TaxID=92651 RepID=UPI003D682F25